MNKRMNKISAVVGLVIISILSLGNTSSCETSVSTLGLKADDAFFARMGDDGEFVPVDDGIFQRGESVYFVLVNVGKFKKGDDGLHRMATDFEIYDPEGDVIFSLKDYLGEVFEQHGTLPNDIAPSPYGELVTHTVLEPGRYRLSMTI